MKLNQIIGQETIKKSIDIQLDACKKQNTQFPHVLLTSPSGLGKTSLALAIANELNLPLNQINAASLKDPISLIYSFINEEEQDLTSQVIFLDEVHNLMKSRSGNKLIESLYTAMEGNYINYEVQGNYGKEIKKQDIPPFTLIAATTEALPEPFINRFRHNFKLEPYSSENIEQIISQYNPDINGALVEPYSRNNPRHAIRLAEWVKDFHISSQKEITESSVKEAMNYIGVHGAGLTNDDLTYLRTLSKMKRSGIKNLSACTGISESKISKEIEPFLLQNNFIYRTDRGRIINLEKIKEWSP